MRNEIYGNQNAKTQAPVAATLNDRLNETADMLQQNCERIESVLSRVNGTPQGADQRSSGDVSRISPLRSLAQVVELLEATSGRLADLTIGVERIA